MRTFHAVATSPCRILKMLTPSVASHAVQRWTLSLSKHHVCTHAHGKIQSLGMADPDTNVAVGVGCQGTLMDSITYAVWAFGTAKTGRLLTVSRLVLLKSTSLEGLTEEIRDHMNNSFQAAQAQVQLTKPLSAKQSAISKQIVASKASAAPSSHPKWSDQHWQKRNNVGFPCRTWYSAAECCSWWGQEEMGRVLYASFRLLSPRSNRLC